MKPLHRTIKTLCDVLEYLAYLVDNLFGFRNVGTDISVIDSIEMTALTIICFIFGSDPPAQSILVNLRNITSRKVGQRLLIFINSAYSIKPDITGFYYKSAPGSIIERPTYWSAKQTSSRYDSLEFIVGPDNEFYLINNNNFNIIERA